MRACHQVAERLGVEAVSVYGARGGTTDSGVRQMVEKILREVESGGIGYVIVQGHDRLTRRPCELACIVRRLAAVRVRLVTTADPAAAFLEQISLVCLVLASSERRAA